MVNGTRDFEQKPNYTCFYFPITPLGHVDLIISQRLYSFISVNREITTSHGYKIILNTYNYNSICSYYRKLVEKKRVNLLKTEKFTT